MQTRYAVVGGGIVGTAVARQILAQFPDVSVTLFEKEGDLGAHQTGHNSGVIHSGLYYTPASLKAVMCRRGVALLEAFCAEKSLPVVRRGKLVVARDQAELSQLDRLHSNAQRNGVPARVVGSSELREMEPFVRGMGALHSPTTAVVDFHAVCVALGADFTARGGRIRLRSTVTGVQAGSSELRLSLVSEHNQQTEAFDRVVVCSGLWSDDLATKVGGDADPMIIPFRGEYFWLAGSKQNIVDHLIYPVPDQRFPFLGVHITPRVDGQVLVGPNAVLAFKREGYSRWGVSRADLTRIARFAGFRHLAKEHWRYGMKEQVRSLVKAAYLREVQRYVPGISLRDLRRGPSGVRAQAVSRAGELVDDFVIEQRGAMTLVRNAPSPAATSSMAIAEHIVGRLAAERPTIQQRPARKESRK